MALGVIPGAPGSEAKAFADLKADLDEKRTARVTAQVEVDVLSQTVRDLKISADRFASRIPTLEDKVKHLEDKVVEGLNEVKSEPRNFAWSAPLGPMMTTRCRSLNSPKSW
jgi:chromosome segregation ATPase